MRPFIYFTIWISLALYSGIASAQETPLIIQDETKSLIIENDTRLQLVSYDSTVKKHSPRTAAIRSAILPGWGQVYNKKAWKVPIVYSALGITGYIFIDNIKTFNEYKFAYAARIKAMSIANPDSTDYNTLKEIYKIIQPESIKAARNRFRQYIDYSVLFFLLFWGLNVVDASVDAHLKSFDVSPDLSLNLRFRPGYSELANTNGISLVVALGKRNKKNILQLK